MASPDLKAWRWSQSFISPSVPSAVVLLDGPVFDGAREDLADLRVISSSGEETPYSLETDRARIEDSRVPAKLLNLVRLPDGSARFELDLGDNPQPHGYMFLDISPDNRNYRAVVTLEGATAKGGWAVLKDGASILDFSQDFHLRYSELYYPESDFRRLRVTIREKDGAALKVDGAWVRRHAHRAGSERPAIFTSSRSTTPVSEVWELDFGHDKMPVHRLEFSVVTPEFKRRVVVSVPERGGSESVIYRYATGRFSGSNLTASFPEVRTRRLRVEIFHYDDRPLTVSGLKAFGYTRRLRLKSPQAGSYSLHYGNPSASSPRYDLADLSSYLDKTGVPELSLGERAENPGYTAPAKPWNEAHPWVLRAALVAAMLLLGVVVLRQWRAAV